MSCTLSDIIYDLTAKSYKFITLRKIKGKTGRREQGKESWIGKNLQIDGHLNNTQERV
jgi:hypothetical protein